MFSLRCQLPFPPCERSQFVSDSTKKHQTLSKIGLMKTENSAAMTSSNLQVTEKLRNEPSIGQQTKNSVKSLAFLKLHQRT
jgi:hypothetical protein